MDDMRAKIKAVLEHSEFDLTMCRLLVESLTKDLTNLYIAANTNNNRDFHSHYTAAMERVFALSDQLK